MTRLYAVFLALFFASCSTTQLIDESKPHGPPDADARRNLLVGTWYGSEKTKDGGRRLEIAELFPDGNMRIRFRYIKESGEHSDTTELAYWGISGPIHFTITLGWVNGDKFKPADLTKAHYYDAYEILKLDSESFRYRSFVTGNEFEIIRVEEGFNFPE
ncbi:MAG TPA: hypothetical protein VLS27_20760 [Gammaproteobacteria bacterium]|nr:hypothetical protein [Gammaproteobacteria bacterium]